MEEYNTYDVDNTKSYAELIMLTDSMEQEILTLRTRNRILSTVNKALRERVNRLQQDTDELVEAIYEYDRIAEEVNKEEDFLDLATEEER